MSIFKADNSSASDRFDDHPRQESRPSRKLDNILLDVSDDSSVGQHSANRSSSKNRSDRLKSSSHIAKSKGGGATERMSGHTHDMRRSHNQSYTQPSHEQPSYRQAYHARPNILPDVLATESIESMLSRIETNLFNVQAIPNLDPIVMAGGSNVHQTVSHQTMSHTMSDEPIISNRSERGSEYGMTDQINNSIIQEIDMLVDKIESE